MSTVALEFETPQFESSPERLIPAKRTHAGWRIAGALLFAWVLSGFYLVAPDQQAVVTLFGRVAAPRVMPGLHYALPWPIESVHRLKVRQLQRLVIGGDLPDRALGRTQPARSQFLTGDQNILNLQVAVQYSVSAPADFLFQAQDPAQVAGAAVEAELARRVAHRGVDALLTTEKIAIQDEVRGAAQTLLNEYRAGIAIASINIENAAPPPEAASAFRDVASARADTARLVSNAQGYGNDLIPKARGQAQQLLEESAGYKRKKIDEANGDAARFNQIAAEYRRAPDVTRQRLYLEAMEQILPRIKKLIVDPNGSVDLTIVRKSEPAPARTNP